MINQVEQIFQTKSTERRINSISTYTRRVRIITDEKFTQARLVWLLHLAGLCFSLSGLKFSREQSKTKEDNHTQLNFDHICIWTLFYIFSRLRESRRTSQGTSRE